jgi:hypothetical protein
MTIEGVLVDVGVGENGAMTQVAQYYSPKCLKCKLQKNCL